MVRLTLVARTRDGLPLAEGLDADKEHEMYSYKSQAKVGRAGWARRALQRRRRPDSPPPPPPGGSTGSRPLSPPVHPQGIFKKMAGSSSKPPPRMSIESGAFTFHYLVDGGDVCYLTLTEKAYPKKLAFQYLEELQSEFSRLYGEQIDSVTRPYAFIKFGACGGVGGGGGGGGGALQSTAGRLCAAPSRRVLTAPCCCSPPARRHVYPEDQEAVPGHAHAAQPGQAEPGHCRGALHHDSQHRRCAGPGRAARP